MLTHRTLDNKITEVQVSKVVTAIAERERRELVDTRLLIWEELILETLVIGIETLVGIEDHGFEGIRTRLSTLDTSLTRLVDSTCLTLCGEELHVDRTTPVVRFLVFLAVVIGKQTDLPVVQILVVGLNREDGDGKLSGMEDIRLSRAYR